MSRQEAVKHYARILKRWPIDRLRPEPKQQLQALLQSRLRNALPGSNNQETTEINAAYLLLDNNFKHTYPLSKELMAPESNPNHYTNLAKELDEIPDRTWFGNVMKRIQNVVRWR